MQTPTPQKESVLRSTDNLRRQHRELLRLTGALREVVGTSPVDAKKTRTLLAQMTGILNVHLAMEDGVMYPQLLRHGDPEVRTTAKRFFDEMGGLRATFGEYLKRWNAPSTIASLEQDFRRESLSVLDALVARITREDEVLYRWVDKLSEVAAES